MHRAKTLILTIAAATGLFAGDFSGTAALDYTRKAVSFGPRPAGTEANQKLQAYIKSQLRTFGCTAVDDKFKASTPVGQRDMNNIIVRIPGTSGKAVVITGHYDTKPMPGTFFVGANDGGSSTGVLLELASVLCKQKHTNDIYLVWLDGEEAFAQWSDTDSLYGSRHLAQKWAADGTARKTTALINLDMIGDRELTLVQEENSNAALRSLVWATAKELGYGSHFPAAGGFIEDDHIPFLREGIPALDLIDFDYGPGNSYWHNDRDTLDKLSADSFTVIGRTMLRVVQKLDAR
jgi:glutaminyl-peptide cyclotransferase